MRRFTSIASAVNAAPAAVAAAKEPLFEIPVGLEDGRVVPLRLFEVGLNPRERLPAITAVVAVRAVVKGKCPTRRPLPSSTASHKAS
jgi:hypothetical protein